MSPFRKKVYFTETFEKKIENFWKIYIKFAQKFKKNSSKYF